MVEQQQHEITSIIVVIYGAGFSAGLQLYDIPCDRKVRYQIDHAFVDDNPKLQGFCSVPS